MSRLTYLLQVMQQQQQGQRNMASKHKRPQQRGKDGRFKPISPEVEPLRKGPPGEPRAAFKPFDDPWHSTADLIVCGALLCALGAGALALGWCAGYLAVALPQIFVFW